MLTVGSLCMEDWEALRGVLGTSFNHPGPSWDVFLRRIGAEHFVVARDEPPDRDGRCDGRVVGGLGAYPMGQYFGGRAVPIGGIAGVGVAPEARGSGVAHAMVVECLRRLRARGVPLAGLYPATLPVYRKSDFEQAGEQVQYACPLASIRGHRLELPVVRIDPTDPLTEQALRARYRPEAGNLDRSAGIWDRVLRPVIGLREVYLLGDEGYAVVGPDVPDAPHWTLEVYDHCAPTAATMRTLLAFLAGHRSLVDTVRWQGQPGDPLLALIAEADWSVAKLRRWMLRVVDVRAALVARGWSSDGEIRLAVNDAIFPENNGPWHLRVRDGEARVEPCTSADLALPVRAMAPLYSGYLSASRLAGLGWAEGSPEPLAAADRLFAGPTPFMREMY